MRRLQPVVWSKGVFLSPQHLQAQDRYIEESMRFVVEAQSFRFWGFLSLQIDGTAICEGQLNILQAAGLLPDGLAFDIPDADAAPSSRGLDACFENGKSACIFYLAIPQSRFGGVNIETQRSGLNTRFYSELQMLRDENNSGTEKPVALARKNLRILADGEDLEGAVVLPLVRVLKTEAGRYRVDDCFIPPMINAKGNQRLVSILRGLVEVLVARSRQLAGPRRQRTQSLADFSASDVANFWLLYSVNTHLPAFRHLLEAKLVHPEAIYGEMLSLSGALTTFSRSIGPMDLPKYEHERQGNCFLALDAVLTDLLNTAVPSSFIALPLERVRDSVYSVEIEKDEYLSKSRLYLAIAAEMPTVELIARTQALVKICSATHLETLIRQALPGLTMSHVTTPPREISVKLNYQYFSLDRTGAAWDAIERARNFGVYIPGEIRNPVMELIILLPSDSGRS